MRAGEAGNEGGGERGGEGPGLVLTGGAADGEWPESGTRFPDRKQRTCWWCEQYPIYGVLFPSSAGLSLGLWFEAPPGLPNHFMNGGAPHPHPAPLFCSLASCASRPTTTPREKQSPTLSQLSLTLLVPCRSTPSPGTKDQKPTRRGPAPRSWRRALCRRSLRLCKTSIVLPETENNASGPVAPRPALAPPNTLSPSPEAGAPELPGPPEGPEGSQMCA